MPGWVAFGKLFHGAQGSACVPGGLLLDSPDTLRIGESMSVEEKVKNIIVEQLGVDMESVTPEASFIDDLGADSLDIVELVMTMEEEFDLEIPDEDAEKIKTVNDVVNYIKAKVN